MAEGEVGEAVDDGGEPARRYIRAKVSNLYYASD